MRSFYIFDFAEKKRKTQANFTHKKLKKIHQNYRFVLNLTFVIFCQRKTKTQKRPSNFFEKIDISSMSKSNNCVEILTFITKKKTVDFTSFQCKIRHFDTDRFTKKFVFCTKSQEGWGRVDQKGPANFLRKTDISFFFCFFSFFCFPFRNCSESHFLLYFSEQIKSIFH